MRKKGIALITVILLMTLLAITSLSLATFVVERLRLTSTRENEINAYYMAQAGIYYGIYQYIINSQASGEYTGYDDRGFIWAVTPGAGNQISVQSTGYSPKSGADRIEKIIQAEYDTSSKKITNINYGT